MRLWTYASCTPMTLSWQPTSALILSLRLTCKPVCRGLFCGGTLGDWRFTLISADACTLGTAIHVALTKLMVTDLPPLRLSAILASSSARVWNIMSKYTRPSPRRLVCWACWEVRSCLGVHQSGFHYTRPMCALSLSLRSLPGIRSPVQTSTASSVSSARQLV